MGNGKSWSPQAKLVANDGAAKDHSDQSVGIYGDTAIVGAPSDGDKGCKSGSAYMFVRDGANNWIEKRKLVADDGKARDLFGWSIAIFGNTAIVGAPGDESAYKFNIDTSYCWKASTVQTKLIPNDRALGDRFGYSVGIYSNTMIVGAPYNDDKGEASGSVYVSTSLTTVSMRCSILDISN